MVGLRLVSYEAPSGRGVEGEKGSCVCGVLGAYEASACVVGVGGVVGLSLVLVG